MRPKLKSRGLSQAMNMVKNLTQGLSHSRGCYLEGRTRQDDIQRGKIINNSDVMDYLAEGDRDISPTDDDADKGARAMVVTVERRLAAMKVKMTPMQATMHTDAGFRAAGTVVMREMWLRVKRELTNDGNPAKKVSKKYAAWRKKHYGIGEQRVFKMSGQLLANLHPTHSNVASIKMVHR